MADNSKSSRKPRAFNLGSSSPQGQKSQKSKAEKNPAASTSSAKPVRAQKKSDKNTKSSSRKPRSIKSGGHSGKVEIARLPDDAVDQAYAASSYQSDLDGVDELELKEPFEQPKKRGFGWGKLAFGALSLIGGLAFSMAFDSFVRDLFERHDWLGYAGLGLVGIFIVAILGLVIRELGALMRLAKVDAIRHEAQRAIDENDLKLARNVSRRVISLFYSRPDTAKARASLQEHQEAVMDGRDVIMLTERDLLSPLDHKARSMVMRSAKRVSVVTAVSPRALVDIGFVLFENIRLIRQIGQHYGGKPGLLGAMRLIRQVVFHLGATGAIAIGDGLLQQLIGHGLAARLSARLGEGVVNGLLTARIGISAMDICRPIPYSSQQRPKVADFLAELMKFQGDEADKK